MPAKYLETPKNRTFQGYDAFIAHPPGSVTPSIALALVNNEDDSTLHSLLISHPLQAADQKVIQELQLPLNSNTMGKMCTLVLRLFLEQEAISHSPSQSVKQTYHERDSK